MGDVRLWMAISGVLVALGLVLDRVGKLSEPYEATHEEAAMDSDAELPAFLRGPARRVTFALAAVAWSVLMLWDAT